MTRRNWTSRQKEIEIRRAFMREGAIRTGEFTAASGQSGDTKINTDVMYNNKPLLNFVASELARRARAFEPDLIVPVPRGANAIGRLVARRMKVEVAFMQWDDKTPGNKAVSPAGETDAAAIIDAERVLVLEDVYSTGISSHTVASHELIKPKVAGVLSIWSRLRESERIEVPYRTATIVEEYIALRTNHG